MSAALNASRRLLEALLASLLPADCDLCRQPLPWRQKGGVCPPCWRALPWAPGLRLAEGPLRAVVWSADYDGGIRRLVHALKFEGIDFLGRRLGEEAAPRLEGLLAIEAGIAQRRGDEARPSLVVPVPLHWLRRYRRGYNQALLLARPIARHLGLPLAAGILVRVRAGRRQLGLSRRERLRSLEGCYETRARVPWRGRPAAQRLEGRTVLLVDDVTTTGATLDACARALLRGGAASVVACVVARTPRGRGAETGGGFSVRG